jgi:hypothetical protein
MLRTSSVKTIDIFLFSQLIVADFAEIAEKA